MNNKFHPCLFAVFFLFLTISLTAQSGYSIYGSALYESIPTSKVTTNLVLASQRLLTGNTYERSENSYETVTSYTFESNPGWHFGANMHFVKATGIGLTTGIRLQYRDFKLNYTFAQTLIASSILDTIEYTAPNSGGVLCDRYESISNSITSVDDGQRYQHLSLQIPLLLNYHLSQGRIRLEAGGFFSTPIYTRVSSQVFTFEMKEEGNETVCYTGRVNQHDTSGNGFSNLTVGLQGGIAYTILPRLHISLGVQKIIQNLISNPNNRNAGFINSPPKAQVKPTSIYLGVNYSFSKKVAEG